VLTTTEGIVLRTQRYTEADLIVTFLTLKKGIIKTFAKSSRKTKSRFGSSLEPLTHAKISLYGKEQSMPRVTQSDILHSYQGIRENFHDFILTSRLSEILLSLTPEGIPNRKLFLFFLNILTILESSGQEPRDALYLISQIRLLAKLGYSPRLQGCGKCNVKSFSFYPDSGTTLCNKCADTFQGVKNQPIKISGKTVHFYSHCIGWPIKISSRLRPAKETISELSTVLEAHLTHLLSKRLLTSHFIASV
jgi:DNA repair protein RecO (recombination protein O)